MKPTLTEKQQKIFSFIVGYLRQHKFPPSMGEIKDEFKFKSLNSVSCHLRALEKKGYVTRYHSNGRIRSRSIEIVDEVLGYYTVRVDQIRKVIKELDKMNMKLDTNTAVEFLRLMEIGIVW